MYEGLIPQSGVNPRYYIKIPNETLFSFFESASLNYIKTEKANSKLVGIPHRLAKISPLFFELLAEFSYQNPSAVLKFIHFESSNLSVQKYILDNLKKVHPNVHHNVLFCSKGYPDYLEELEECRFYFGSVPVPGGRGVIQGLSRGILSPILEIPHHIYSQYTSLIYRLLNLQFCMANNKEEYLQISSKLFCLEQPECMAISTSVVQKINNYQQSFSFKKELEKILLSL